MSNDVTKLFYWFFLLLPSALELSLRCALSPLCAAAMQERSLKASIMRQYFLDVLELKSVFPKLLTLKLSFLLMKIYRFNFFIAIFFNGVSDLTLIL